MFVVGKILLAALCCIVTSESVVALLLFIAPTTVVLSYLFVTLMLYVALMSGLTLMFEVLEFIVACKPIVALMYVASYAVVAFTRYASLGMIVHSFLASPGIFPFSEMTLRGSQLLPVNTTTDDVYLNTNAANWLEGIPAICSFMCDISFI